MTTPTTHPNNWIVDSGASHNITSDLHNFFIYNDYGGNEDIIIGDDNGILIIYTGSIILNSHTTTFTLDDVLCAPHIKMNFIFVSQFCKQTKLQLNSFLTLFL